MLTVSMPLTSSCRTCVPDSLLMIGSCFNGCVSVDIISLLESSGLISMFGSSRNGHVVGILEVDGVPFLGPSGNIAEMP